MSDAVGSVSSMMKALDEQKGGELRFLHPELWVRSYSPNSRPHMSSIYCCLLDVTGTKVALSSDGSLGRT